MPFKNNSEILPFEDHFYILGGIIDQVAKGSKPKEVQKKENKPENPKEPSAGFKGLPSGIASILFGGSAQTSSSSGKGSSSTTGNANSKSETRDPRKKPGPVASGVTAAKPEAEKWKPLGSSQQPEPSGKWKPIGVAQPEPEKLSNKKPSTKLGSMTEADLLAAAAAQMGEIPPLPPIG